MCRFIAYRGEPLCLDDLVYQPSNSLIHQAVDATESRTRVNADGFGIGWYNPTVHAEPAVFKDTTPAWNNSNLRSLARTVVAPCIVAHVRAATRNDPVSRENCHPFQYGPLLWMHNGDVPCRGRLHRRVVERAEDALVARIAGNTDSELAFILFLGFLGPPLDRRFTARELADALGRTIERIAAWRQEDGEQRLLGLNICVTDGRVLVASRFSRGGDALSLHYCVGSRYVCDGGTCRVESGDPDRHCVVVSSEMLSDDPHWRTVDPDRLIVVNGDLSVESAALEIP